MIFRKFRLHNASKKYAAKLPAWLTRAYGHHEFYTEAQLRRAVQKLGLDRNFIAIAFANYMSETNYNKQRLTLPIDVDYRTGRKIFLENRPISAASHSGNRPPEIGVDLFGGTGS
ncbi:MAG TPA: DUF6559 family protein [Rhizomicrobium sp.]|jgi:hypothetical protein|nr:DUF6559 family protein [Rhizomicrobium sp.]